MPADSPLAAELSDRTKFTEWVTATLRANDIDYQGHVNNSVHPVLFTDGRYSFVTTHLRPGIADKDMFALVKVTIEYLGEMHFPGQVEIGTRVARVGRSSLTFGQGMFNNGRCVAVCESVLVFMDKTTRRAQPWPEEIAAHLNTFAAVAG